MANEVKTGLRIPEELYEAIKKLSETDRRSINAQMVVLLQEAVEARHAPSEQQRRATSFAAGRARPPIPGTEE